MARNLRFENALLLLLLAGLLAGAGCARNRLVMELQGTVMYEKPSIASVSHSLEDRRSDDGAAVVEIVVEGDPGLAATFDITPEIVSRAPMREVADGRYVGVFSFPAGVVGGPYAIVGRLEHERAGQVVLRDAKTLFIPLAPRRR